MSNSKQLSEYLNLKKVEALKRNIETLKVNQEKKLNNYFDQIYEDCLICPYKITNLCYSEIRVPQVDNENYPLRIRIIGGTVEEGIVEHYTFLVSPMFLFPINCQTAVSLRYLGNVEGIN